MSPTTSPSLTETSAHRVTTTLGMHEREALQQNLGNLVDCLIRNNIDLQFARQRLDCLYIGEILRHHGGNIGQAAKAMGVHRNTLSKRIKDLNILVKVNE